VISWLTHRLAGQLIKPHCRYGAFLPLLTVTFKYQIPVYFKEIRNEKTKVLIG
jgi:hypothetical protein